MTVKRVLRGLISYYNIEEVHIISPERVIFSGSVVAWNKTVADMANYKRIVEGMEVKKRLIFNGRKAFIFIASAPQWTG